VKLFSKLQTWWQVNTGQEETPFDRDSTAFLASVVVHCFLLVSLGLWPMIFEEEKLDLTMTEVERVEELKVNEEVYFDDQPTVDIGAVSLADTEMATSQAPEISEVSAIPNPVEITTDVVSEIPVNQQVEVATGLKFSELLPVKGYVGESTRGATGAIDRITHEILLSMQERRTLVVWFFDQSASLMRERQAIHDRFDRVYEELGVLQAAGNPAFRQQASKPLLTAMVAFGKQVTYPLGDPTDNLTEIKDALKNIARDDSGHERVFEAVYKSTNKFKSYRESGTDGEPKRNVMFIVVTDEAGDDQSGLEPTIKICNRHAIPVYVVGVPAPFGRKITQVKWVDPDPKFDQSAQWGEVSQGPESFLPERIKLHFSGSREDQAPISSGFGPFALTRLTIETGGQYIPVHPNRQVGKDLKRSDTAAYAAYFKRFFDPQRMRLYQPDYVSSQEYMRRINGNKMRSSLMQAAAKSWLTPMAEPQVRFVKRDEATFSTMLSEAQKGAAILEPRVNQLYQVLKLGESERPQENSARWQAGYDLAMGRVMAVKARTEAYNAMLAKAKRGLKFKNPKSNTWILQPADELTVGSQLSKTGDKAKEYLARVVEEHAGTPWALLAQRELDQQIGWKWVEDFTDLAPRPRGGGGGNNNPAPAANDRAQMLKKPAPKRKPPKL